MILGLIAVIALCFSAEIFMARPDFAAVASGLIPRLNGQSLYIAVAMLGATVMPHNLYLHSALVQTRRIGHSEDEKRTACKYNLIDSVVALNGAMFVNGAILILAGAVFFVHHQDVTEISQAYLLLTPILSTVIASKLFGIALFVRGSLPR